MTEEQSVYDRLTRPHTWPNPAPFVPKTLTGEHEFQRSQDTQRRWGALDGESLKDRILDAARADDEAAVHDRHLAAERAECEHVALFTLRDALTEEWTEHTHLHVEAAITILRYLLDTRP